TTLCRSVAGPEGVARGRGCTLFHDNEIGFSHPHSPHTMDWLVFSALRQHSRQIFSGAGRPGSSAAPAWLVSVSSVFPGSLGAAPAPVPGLPPAFCRILGPTRVTPAGVMRIKLPPAWRVSSLPASI